MKSSILILGLCMAKKVAFTTAVASSREQASATIFLSELIKFGVQVCTIELSTLTLREAAVVLTFPHGAGTPQTVQDFTVCNMRDRDLNLGI